MLIDKPIFIDEIDELRADILTLESQDNKRAQLWKLLKSSARTAPLSFAWFTPFVALITRDPEDIENARLVIRTYISKFDPMSFNSGLQLHFWCFAFPHAKWCMYFQWLCTIGAFDKQEQDRIAEELIKYHFINYYYGLNTKPEPECVDNQTLSLAYSSAFVGYLFSQGENPSEMAKIIYRDGLRRLPGIIGAMPKSGYSGEGSTYMDRVNGPAIPFAIELLELITGKHGLLFVPFEPNGCKPIKVLEIVAREWMPGGLLLPWDNYGYQYGTRSAIAYAARKTGGAEYLDILENRCIWPYDVGVGWAYDDLVWTLVWWPTDVFANSSEGKCWYDEEVGGILESTDSNRYIAQLWDESAQMMPARCHVNPNIVIFNGYKTPLSADGSPDGQKCERFRFSDTFREVSFLSIGHNSTYNYGDGCAGAHSVTLIDGWEGMRAMQAYPQVKDSYADLQAGLVYADVTPIYKEKWDDVKKVARKSMIHYDTFFTVEDLSVFDENHTVTSRFLLRPDFVECERGIKIETPEGVTLNIFDVLGCKTISCEQVYNHPKKPDGRSVLVDFTSKGTKSRRLFVAFISRTRKAAEYESGFKCIPDADMSLNYESANVELEVCDTIVPMRMPAYMEANLPAVKRWWYKGCIQKKTGEAYIVLPCGLHDPMLWINGEEISLSAFEKSGTLLPPHVKLSEKLANCEFIDVVLRTNVPISHFEDGENGNIGLNGGLSMCYPCKEEQVLDFKYDGSYLRLITNVREYVSQYQLMEE